MYYCTCYHYVIVYCIKYLHIQENGDQVTYCYFFCCQIDSGQEVHKIEACLPIGVNYYPADTFEYNLNAK